MESSERKQSADTPFPTRLNPTTGPSGACPASPRHREREADDAAVPCVVGLGRRGGRFDRVNGTASKPSSI